MHNLVEPGNIGQQQAKSSRGAHIKQVKEGAEKLASTRQEAWGQNAIYILCADLLKWILDIR